MTKCKICDNDANNAYFKARDMLRGTRVEYDYMECTACGCVQLTEVPKNMADYYSNVRYGSFISSERSGLKKKIRIIRNKYAILGSGGLFRYLLNQIAPLTED